MLYHAAFGLRPITTKAKSGMIGWVSKPAHLKQIVMTTQTRDTIALFSIAATAVLAVLYADVDLSEIFLRLLARL